MSNVLPWPMPPVLHTPGVLPRGPTGICRDRERDKDRDKETGIGKEQRERGTRKETETDGSGSRETGTRTDRGTETGTKERGPREERDKDSNRVVLLFLSLSLCLLLPVLIILPRFLSLCLSVPNPLTLYPCPKACHSGLIPICSCLCPCSFVLSLSFLHYIPALQSLFHSLCMSLFLSVPVPQSLSHCPLYLFGPVPVPLLYANKVGMIY